jgi:hypothetical protein
MRSHLSYFTSILLVLAGLALAQEKPPVQPAANPASPAPAKAEGANAVDNAFLQKQFGTEYTLDAGLSSRGEPISMVTALKTS